MYLYVYKVKKEKQIGIYFFHYESLLYFYMIQNTYLYFKK